MSKKEELRPGWTATVLSSDGKERVLTPKLMWDAFRQMGRTGTMPRWEDVEARKFWHDAVRINGIEAENKSIKAEVERMAKLLQEEAIARRAAEAKVRRFINEKHNKTQTLRSLRKRYGALQRKYEQLGLWSMGAQGVEKP